MSSRKRPAHPWSYDATKGKTEECIRMSRAAVMRRQAERDVEQYGYVKQRNYERSRR